MNTISRRDLIGCAMQATALAALSHPFAVSAQPMLETAKVLFGFGPGGVVDGLTRRIIDQLLSDYARSVVIDYRTGVGGRLAADALVAAPADGSVMMHGPVGIFTFRPHIEKLGFDPLNDVLPVSLTCGFADAIGVGPMVPASVKTVADFLEWCGANPKLASYGSPGVGTPPHLIATLLGRSSGVELTHIPYRQAGAVQDVMAGQLASLINIESAFVPFINDGKLRVLATSGTERSPSFPNVPTFLELGYKELVVRDWQAMFVPAKTPADVVRRLAGAVHAALKRPENEEMLVKNGLQPASSTPAELGALMKREYEHWAAVMRATGFTATS